MTISSTNSYIDEIVLDFERISDINFRNKQREVIEYIATLNFKKIGVRGLLNP
ncbi:hypothetical protein [Candidatus Nitrosocosmicus arcticus]|uniref:Uncharacterized protein n=1 Tax=Candidatus Nitrosocosmicus arcticus TaxID=2035267 RepID=A0A557SW18_9ARCH|nr:hypothetical protein [Candidatus Nitrosocosmicus arcticus]TVP40798.1 hypothetical protein NARC_60185 [Candidatus Nitrosocosmicus arcticus]